MHVINLEADLGTYSQVVDSGIPFHRLQCTRGAVRDSVARAHTCRQNSRRHYLVARVIAVLPSITRRESRVRLLGLRLASSTLLAEAQHAHQRMTTVLAGARVSQCFSSRCAQTERVIEFAIRKQTCIGRYDGAAKLHRHAPIEIDAKNVVLRFTRQVRHVRTDRSSKTYCYYSEITATMQHFSRIHLANAGLVSFRGSSGFVVGK